MIIMSLQCVTITPLLPAFGSDKFQLRFEHNIWLFNQPKEWILYLFSDLSSYVHSSALLIGVDSDNPNLLSSNPPYYGIPNMNEDISVHPLTASSKMTSDFSVIVLCVRP